MKKVLKCCDKLEYKLQAALVYHTPPFPEIEAWSVAPVCRSACCTSGVESYAVQTMDLHNYTGAWFMLIEFPDITGH